MRPPGVLSQGLEPRRMSPAQPGESGLGWAHAARLQALGPNPGGYIGKTSPAFVRAVNAAP